MENQLSILKNHRDVLLTQIADLNQEQLCQIPTGFSNNIIWNLGHIVVTQQLLSYGLTGNSFKISDELIQKYRKGSTASLEVSLEEIQLIKYLFIDLITIFAEDYKQHQFNNFNHYKTSMGLELNSIEESVSFMAYHEGIHFGIILSLLKQLNLGNRQ